MKDKKREIIDNIKRVTDKLETVPHVSAKAYGRAISGYLIELEQAVAKVKQKIGMYGETPKIQIGKLSICLQDGSDPLGKVWIEEEDCEGGEFPCEKVEKVLQEFYDKNF